MPSGKTVKLVLYEVLQLAALSVPVLVVMERFACLMRDLGGRDQTAYWLVVAASVAYVTTSTLVVWAPLKYLILKRQRLVTQFRHWRPTALAYVVLCILPCFAIFIASSKVQVERGFHIDLLTELPVSLVLFSLICVDIIERIRPCNLIGRGSLDADFDMPSPILTHLEQVTSVSGQLYPDRGRSGSAHAPPEVRNGAASGRMEDLDDSHSHSTVIARPPSYVYRSRSHPLSYSGPLGSLRAKDERSGLFVDSFVFWMDTVEMVRVAGEPAVFYSGWVFPIYILAFLSTLRLVMTPHSLLMYFAGFALQDLPFLVIRIALISVFGYVTPVLYPMKNILVCLAYIYFTFLTKLKIFKRESLF